MLNKIYQELVAIREELQILRRDLELMMPSKEIDLKEYKGSVAFPLKEEQQL